MDLGKVKELALDISVSLEMTDVDTGAYIDAAKEKAALLIAEIEKPAEDIERAYQVLEAYGVPRERAKTLANGIDVLETRYRKDLNCFETEKQQYAESYHAKKRAEVLSSAADRAMAVYARDCDGCSPRLSDDCDERCPYIAKIRRAIMETPRA